MVGGLDFEGEVGIGTRKDSDGAIFEYLSQSWLRICSGDRSY